MRITYKELPQYIDQTLLKPYSTTGDLRAFCQENAPFGFATIMVHSAAVAKCRAFLEGTGARLACVIGFCLGQSTIESKAFETIGAIADGADELDYVANFAEVKSGNFAYAEEEMRRLTGICHDHGRPIKVILENCYLTDEEKTRLCEIALRVRPDFVKTSTGFGTGGATLADVQLMKRVVGDAVQVKAAGGIRTLDDAESFLRAGATRLGCSAGRKLLDEMRATNRVIEL